MGVGLMIAVCDQKWCSCVWSVLLTDGSSAHNILMGGSSSAKSVPMHCLTGAVLAISL